MNIDKIKSRKLKKDFDQEIEENSVTDVSSKGYEEVLKKVNSSRSVAIERKTRAVNKNLKGKKIKKTNLELEETKLDKEIEASDNLSVTVIFLILVTCFVVGGVLGYMLYRIVFG